MPKAVYCDQIAVFSHFFANCICNCVGLTAEQGEYGAVDNYGKYGRDVRVEKFLGVDGTSDGYSKGIDYKTNLLR